MMWSIGGSNNTPFFASNGSSSRVVRHVSLEPAMIRWSFQVCWLSLLSGPLVVSDNPWISIPNFHTTQLVVGSLPVSRQ